MMTPRLLKNAHQAAIYYEADDYYVDGQQLSPSSWWGEGASRLGLRGAVDRETFHELLHGRLPNGVDLARGGGTSHRPGLDLTFSAPKSVSLVALVGADDRVLKAHEHAVTVALRHLEQRAVRVRVMREGVTRIEEADNLVVARFNHDSSRARDPQLHSHAVVLNVTQRGDWEWRAISNEEIFRSVKAASVIYRAELAARLEEIGYRVERTHADGRFEIAGFTKEVLAVFSQRRADIEAHLEALGLEGPRAAAVAARATREKKQEVVRSVLRAGWTARASDLGIDFDQGRGTPLDRELGQTRIEADRALDHAVAHFTERKVVVSERRLIEAALGYAVGSVRLEDVERALERKLERKELLPASSSRERDPFARSFTTDRALGVEQDLLDLARKSRGCVKPILAADQIEQAFTVIDQQGAFPLTSGQRDAIRLALSTNDRVVAIQGYAGTGKTSGALLHIRRIAETEGIEVRGFTPSAAAAEILQRDAGIPSMTLARFLRRSKREPRPKRGELWVVDEASMLGNEIARALLEVAHRRRARVILVGDRDQLPAIEAGRAFGLLVDHGLRTATIDTIVRQKNAGLRQAVVETIAHEHERALDLLAPRIVAIARRHDRLRAVAGAYAALPELQRNEALVITSSNRDRRDLNELIRRDLKAKNGIGPDQVRASVLVGRDLTKAETLDVAQYEVGDVVRFGRRYKRLRVEKDTYFSVKAVNRAHGIITLVGEDREVRWKPTAATKMELFKVESRALAVGDLIRWTRNDGDRGRINAETGRVLAIDRDRREAQVLVGNMLHLVDLDRERHWEHAYASTVHAAQGRTADSVFLHIDTSEPHLLGHESWYVGISRARKDVRIFTDAVDRLPESLRPSLQQESALEAARISPERDIPSRARDVERGKERRAFARGFEIGR